MSASKDSSLSQSQVTLNCEYSSLSQSLANPELNNHSWSNSTGHSNPLLAKQKPFLAQAKTKVYKLEKEPSGIHRIKPQERSQENAQLKSSCVVERNEKNKNKYDYLIYAQKQHQLAMENSKELQNSNKSKELPPEPPKEEIKTVRIETVKQITDRKDIQNEKVSELTSKVS